ncbi:APC family permease [soil metagenome]
MSVDTNVSSKGLSKGSIGLLASVALGISVIAPAYTMTISAGPTVGEVGEQMPAIFLLGFIPMLLVAFGYRELNSDSPDSGTSFTWGTKAFGPFIGFMGGWGLIAATIIVLSNLAAVAVDFFYLALSQIFDDDSIAGWADKTWLNILTCTVFVAIAVYISYRGINTTKTVQYVLVALQLGVLIWFIIACFAKAGGSDSPSDLSFSMSWFNPFEISSLSALTAGISLSIFVYWGWDTCLTLNEETEGAASTPGKAATLTITAIVVLYLLLAVAVMVFAGVGDTGIGLANPESNEDIFVSLASPVMGPFAVLLSIAVLTSAAASLQSTFMSPTRTMLAMGHYKALPTRFANIDERFKSPAFATIVAGIAAALFYGMMHAISDKVLTDTILSLGLMICFYYGITAFACVWYFRESLFSSGRNFFLRLFAPLFGGLVLTGVFIKTLIDSADPDYGSGSSVGGLGTVFILGVGIILFGVVLMGIMYAIAPAFFKGETLKRDTPAFTEEDITTP